MRADSIEQLIALLEKLKDSSANGSINADAKSLRLNLSEQDLEGVNILDDKNSNRYLLIPDSFIKNALEIIKNEYDMRMDAEITRDIILHAPIDFEDVLSVVSSQINKLKDNGEEPSKINILGLVSEIKKNYPHLFRH